MYTAETVFGTYGHLRTQIPVTCTRSQPPRARPRSSAHVNPGHMYTQRSHVHVRAPPLALQHTMICSHKFLLSLDFTSKNELVGSTSRVVATSGTRAVFIGLFTSKNGRFYFACLAIFGHKSCFHWILPVKMDVSTSRVVAIFTCTSCDLRRRV